MKWDGIINLKRRSPEAAAAYLMGQRNLLLRYQRQALKDIEASEEFIETRDAFVTMLARINQDLHHIELIQKMPKV